ncbi:LANO_0E01640g1_1 [Lachancea nothofagi CBS 11611]|uniref:LANO_0E01640g1_1 n=1 Tax=Lachancea nothofagi CBS 11611 TaxID=1266666 RepID=A0A1G4JPX3_9SACH|nr:LANO_0E01640g1_1 [Lachancea nothofagi CBS 11611]
MARKNGNRTKSGASKEQDPYGLNEVDDFASKREKVMLERAGLASQVDESDDDGLMDDQEEEQVLDVENSESEEEEENDEDEELDGEAAYRQVFGRKMETHGDEDEKADAMLDNDGAWGPTKNEYYGADDLDDDETAKEIEKEALRQQRKHLADLNMNDFLDEEVEQDWAQSAKNFTLGQFQADSTTKAADTTTRAKDIFTMTPEGKERLLKTWCPEFFPLSKELALWSAELEKVKAQSQTGEAGSLKVAALSSYLGTISSYFAVLLHELQTNDDFQGMKEHPIMESILTSKEIWRQARELPDEVSPQDQEQDSEVDAVSDLETLDEELLENREHDGSSDASVQESDDEDETTDAFNFDMKPRVHKTNDNLLPSAEVDDFVESEVADVDAQEKKARKKTLRFYTSKIDQQANKKIDRYKGDDDIPYKERLFERQQRLLEEARKRGQAGPDSAQLDSKDYDSEDEKVAQNINKDSSNDYYSKIQQDGTNKKQARRQAHKDATLANRSGNLAALSGEADDNTKRAVNYQIMKNKGLTPHRKKDNRNSRVKKRNKYDKAQKKLKSVRAVYSGGQTGSYEGEKTGIKKNLTRSVKFRE